jgi:hypothetical protein
LTPINEEEKQTSSREFKHWNIMETSWGTVEK